MEVSIEQVIGGAEGVGKGWKMLAECSLPVEASPSSQAAGAHEPYASCPYAQVHKQFGLPIAQFGGVKPLHAWGLTATSSMLSKLSAGGVDLGLKLLWYLPL